MLYCEYQRNIWKGWYWKIDIYRWYVGWRSNHLINPLWRTTCVVPFSAQFRSLVNSSKLYCTNPTENPEHCRSQKLPKSLQFATSVHCNPPAICSAPWSIAHNHVVHPFSWESFNQLTHLPRRNPHGSWHRNVPPDGPTRSVAISPPSKSEEDTNFTTNRSSSSSSSEKFTP